MLKPKKNLGQNFLVDEKVIKNLVETAGITKDNTVLEIGAGTGNVTRELAKRAGKVLAVEFDRALIPVLQKTLQNYNNIKIINEDILKLNLSGMRYAERGKLISTVVGSIPFQITSPLIHKLLGANEHNGSEVKEAALHYPTIIILIQKEVAEKINAAPPNANYLSSFVQGLANVTYIQNVPKTAFDPKPNVEGAIIKIEPHYNVLINHNFSPLNWRTFLHKGFKHPRKMLRNTFDENTLKAVSIAPTARPQELEVTQWINLLKISFR